MTTMDPEIDLGEARDRLIQEILRQHPDTQMYGHMATANRNAMFNVTDLAKAALGMRVTRWDQP